MWMWAPYVFCSGWMGTLVNFSLFFSSVPVRTGPRCKRWLTLCSCLRQMLNWLCVCLPLHSIRWILQATSTTTEQRWEAPRRGPSQPTAAERRWGFNKTRLGIDSEFLWRLLQKQIYSDSQPQTWKSEHLCCRLNIYISNICLRYR